MTPTIIILSFVLFLVFLALAEQLHELGKTRVVFTADDRASVVIGQFAESIRQFGIASEQASVGFARLGYAMKQAGLDMDGEGEDTE